MKKTELKESPRKYLDPGYKFSGGILKLLREDAKMTQEALGGRFKKAATTVGNWEKGICAPKMDTIRGLAQYFNMKPSDFLIKND